MTNLTLLYTGFLAFNRNGRLEFIKLMDDVLTLANSETIYDDKYDNDSLLTRFVKSSVRPTNETFDVFAQVSLKREPNEVEEDKMLLESFAKIKATKLNKPDD